MSSMQGTLRGTNTAPTLLQQVLLLSLLALLVQKYETCQSKLRTAVHLAVVAHEQHAWHAQRVTQQAAEHEPARVNPKVSYKCMRPSAASV